MRTLKEKTIEQRIIKTQKLTINNLLIRLKRVENLESELIGLAEEFVWQKECLEILQKQVCDLKERLSLVELENAL